MLSTVKNHGPKYLHSNGQTQIHAHTPPDAHASFSHLQRPDPEPKRSNSSEGGPGVQGGVRGARHHLQPAAALPPGLRRRPRQGRLPPPVPSRRRQRGRRPEHPVQPRGRAGRPRRRQISHPGARRGDGASSPGRARARARIRPPSLSFFPDGARARRSSRPAELAPAARPSSPVPALRVGHEVRWPRAQAEEGPKPRYINS